MESTIRVDFRDDGNGLQPVIAVKLIDSDDTRDSLLKTFFQSLGGNSSWVRVEFSHPMNYDGQSSPVKFITLYPIRSEEIPTLIEIAQDRINPDRVHLSTNTAT